MLTPCIFSSFKLYVLTNITWNYFFLTHVRLKIWNLIFTKKNRCCWLFWYNFVFYCDLTLCDLDLFYSFYFRYWNWSWIGCLWWELLLCSIQPQLLCVCLLLSFFLFYSLIQLKSIHFYSHLRWPFHIEFAEKAALFFFNCVLRFVCKYAALLLFHPFSILVCGVHYDTIFLFFFAEWAMWIKACFMKQWKCRFICWAF